MCGLNGIVRAEGSPPIEESVAIAMRDSLTHRGPDDADSRLWPGVALGSRRLAILDLSQRGRMPMKSPDGRYWISYNGEVYNYRDLRSGLEGRGHTFTSNTDTEVILRLFAVEGPEMLKRLNGMFAIAIWDTQERSLFLARDRLGVKPLYYACGDRWLSFASEQKALFAAGIQPRFDPTTWEELLFFRFVAGERTPYEGIRRLLPGHFLTWKDGRLTIRRWWSLAERVRALRESPQAGATEWFRATFDNAVDIRRISDVPIGVLLSGGLDSSSIAASLALQGGSGLSSFTVRFEEPGYDEGPLARKVAEHWGFNHHEITVDHDRLLESLLQASYFNDEPLAHDSDLHLLAVSRYAKSRVTVLLSGEGGDETLGGYVRYRPLHHPRLIGLGRPLLPPLTNLMPMPGRVRKLARFLALDSLQAFVFYNACDLLPIDLEGLGVSLGGNVDFRRQVLEEATELYPGLPVRQAMYSDQHTFLCSVLDRNDKTTMAASIECRVPFLDYRLVEGLAALPNSALFPSASGKPFLRRAMRDRLLPAVRRHRRWGFGVPWRRYLRQVPDLAGLVENLPEMEPIRSGPFGRAALREQIRRFRNGDDAPYDLLRGLVMISLWFEACVKSRPALPHSYESTGEDLVDRFSPRG